MALDLQDIGAVKVHPEVLALLTAKSQMEKMDRVAFIRRLLHEWARKEFDTFKLAEKIAISNDLTGITGDWK